MRKRWRAQEDQAGQEEGRCQEEKVHLWSNEDSRQTQLYQSFAFVEILKLITPCWQPGCHVCRAWLVVLTAGQEWDEWVIAGRREIMTVWQMNFHLMWQKENGGCGRVLKYSEVMLMLNNSQLVLGHSGQWRLIHNIQQTSQLLFRYQGQM